MNFIMHQLEKDLLRRLLRVDGKDSHEEAEAVQNNNIAFIKGS